MIRATLLFCLTILSSVAVVVFMNTQQDRFIVVPQGEGVYIFDRKTTSTNYCNQDSCKAVSTEFLTPKQVLVAQIPGVEQPKANATPAAAPVAQQPQPAPVQSLVNPNFSMPGMNNVQPRPQIAPAMPRAPVFNNQGPAMGQPMMRDPMAEENDMGPVGPQMGPAGRF